MTLWYIIIFAKFLCVWYIAVFPNFVGKNVFVFAFFPIVPLSIEEVTFTCLS